MQRHSSFFCPSPFVSCSSRAHWLLLAISLLLSASARSYAAPPPPPVWVRDPALSPLLIQQLVTDPAGFRWVATNEGVFRYDGYEAVPLARLVRRGGRLPAVTFVPALALDRAGHLWIGSEVGLFRFEPITGTLMAVPLGLPTDERPAVHTLFCHPRTGHLWVNCGRDGLLLFDPTRPQAPRYPLRRLGEGPLLLVPTATDGGAWLSNDQTLFLLAADGRIRRRFPTAGQLLPLADIVPQRFFGPQGLYVFASDSAASLREICRWPQPVPAPHDPFFETDSTLDVGVQGQWLHVSGIRSATPRLTFTPLLLGPGHRQPDRRHYSLTRDTFGTWWCFSRTWRGCFKQRPMRQWVQPVLTAEGATATSTRTIARLPDRRLLVSTYGETLTQAADSPAAPLRVFPLWLPHPDGAVSYKTAFDGLLPDLTDPTGRSALVADESWGVGRLDLITGNVRNLAGGPINDWHPATNGPNRAYALLRDRDGRIWAGGQTGLFQLSNDGKTTHRFADDNLRWPLHRLDVMGLAEDPANRALWVASGGGLFWLQPDGARQLRRFGVNALANRRLPSDAISAVTSAGPGRVWVGTRDQGLLLVDARKGLIRQISVPEGLPSHSVAAVQLDRQGAVWISTYAGLVRYVPTEGRLAVFGEMEGLRDAELNRYSALADHDGSLWFGGIGGVHRLWPAQVARAAQRERAPRLLPTALGLPAGADTDVQPLANGALSRLTLAAGPEAFVELHLALSDHFAPDLVRYSYRLVGAGATAGAPALTGWLATPHRLLLRGLIPGDYTVEVRAETAPGQYAGNGLRLPLHVAAAWWQLPVVWLLAAGILLALGYGIYRRHLHRALREMHLRAELAANLHDEVGALLTRVNLLAEVLREQHQPVITNVRTTTPTTTTEPSGSGPFDRLLYNSRAAVQTMRDVVWGIDSRADSVGALLDRMRDHLDQTAGPANLHVTFRHEGLNAQTPLPPSLRQHLYLIFKEAVTNTVRHARHPTMLHVQFSREKKQLILVIRDDGQPAPNARPGVTGMGVRNMHQRAAAIRADLYMGPRTDGQTGYEVRVRV